MRKVVLFTLVAVMAFAVGAYAQKPDFSGKWVLNADKSAMGGGPGGGAPGGGGGGRAGGGMGAGPLAITQTATTLTIERTVAETVMKTIYKFDGSESVNEGRGGMKSTYVSKWDGAKLVTTIKGETQRGPTQSSEVRSLAADGTMVVETTRQGQDGPVTTKMVYDKQK
jgi:hypothetical protein